MDSLLDLVFNGENVRTILLMVVITGGFLLQNAKMDKRFIEMEGRLNAKIDMLKFNDFAHLAEAFRNLTFVLEDRKLISAKDKAFIDQPLEGV